jgi:glycosyltransferase involved in cell wall biosynthesis
MPPARTGVADYSAAMVEALRAQGCTVKVGGEGDVDVYHIGNNPLHRQIHERAICRPGVAVIHDAVLHHFHLGFGDEQRYIDEFAFNYGEWTRGQARQLWRNRAHSGSDPLYFRYPMLRRVVEASRLVVVHNPGAMEMVRAHVPEAQVVELPHLCPPPPPADPYSVLELRHRWNLPANAFVFGVFGHLRESKRLRTIIHAARRTNSYLLLAGDFVSSDYARAIEPELRGAGQIIRVAYLPEAEFWHHAHAVDACINLRYPAAGETSGIAIRLMATGKPVILSAGLEASCYPAGTCLNVDTGPAEEEMLAAVMLLLRQSPAFARGMGERASVHIRKFHDASAVASGFIKLLKSIGSAIVV